MRPRLAGMLGVALLAAFVARAAAGDASDVADPARLAPYKMVRTLEYVQDSIVAGDHAAMGMQSFLLKSIDARLRQADAATFDDSRNADAALIYAMSGGNPDTLDLLASKDVEGHFDHQLTVALHRYFSGNPERARADLEALQPRFLDTTIGPYLTLVTANAAARDEPKKALALFDWVRLLAPGSILEESALRRSIYLADKLDMPKAGLDYARDYALRFVKSPYAGQFADLFVRLVVDNTDTIAESDIESVVGGMDAERQTAIYLRIARSAVIAGKMELGAAAAGRAGALSPEGDATTATLSAFYKAIATIATDGAPAAQRHIADIAPSDLSVRDQALRMAALATAQSMLEPASEQSIAQASKRSHVPERAQSRSLLAPSRQKIASHRTTDWSKAQADAAKEFSAFVAARRSKIDAIDDLLKKGG